MKSLFIFLLSLLLALDGCSDAVLKDLGQIAFTFLIGIALLLALTMTLLVLATLKFPKQVALIVATGVSALAISHLIREAWQNDHKQIVRVLLFAAAFLLCYELYLLFSIVFTL